MRMGGKKGGRVDGLDFFESLGTQIFFVREYWWGTDDSWRVHATALSNPEMADAERERERGRKRERKRMGLREHVCV